MIGIHGLPSGAYGAQFNGGALWLLVENGLITRAEWWDRAQGMQYVWQATRRRARRSAWPSRSKSARKGGDAAA